MAGKDAHDNPYRARHRRFVLPCAECGAVERVRGMRRPEPDSRWFAYEPLCEDCTGIWRRVWPTKVVRVPEHDSFLDERDITLHVILCPRCDGTGLFYTGICGMCLGFRYEIQDDRGVRRTARWWQTYQQNRTPSPDPAEPQQVDLGPSRAENKMEET